MSRELRDQSLHFLSAFVLVSLASLLGATISPLAGGAIGLSLGFVREFTEWQRGDRHLLSDGSLLDLSFWTLGGLWPVLV